MISGFNKAHSKSEQTTESSLNDTSTNNSSESLNQESTSQHQIVTQPPLDNFNQQPQNEVSDEIHYDGVLSDFGHEEYSFKPRSLPEDHFHPEQQENFMDIKEEKPDSIYVEPIQFSTHSYHIRNLPTDSDDSFYQKIENEDVSLRDEKSIETSTTELIETEEDDAIYDSNGRNLIDKSTEKIESSTKMHIFHQQTSENMHSNNETQNEHQISTENSHGEGGQNNSEQHDELVENMQNSTEYMTENMVDRDEANLNSKSTIYPNDVSNDDEPGSNFDAIEKNNNEGEQSLNENNHESEISSTQSHSSTQSTDNESTSKASDIKADEQSSSTNNSQEGNWRRTTRFMKRRKIRKSRPITTTEALTTVK